MLAADSKMHSWRKLLSHSSMLPLEYYSAHQEGASVFQWFTNFESNISDMSETETVRKREHSKCGTKRTVRPEQKSITKTKALSGHFGSCETGSTTFAGSSSSLKGFQPVEKQWRFFWSGKALHCLKNSIACLIEGYAFHILSSELKLTAGK